MKKGFTLIELLAVIAILAIIMLIATPRVLDAIESSRINAYKQDEQMLVKATQTYFGKNADLLPENIGETVEVTINDLKTNELIGEVSDQAGSCDGYTLVTKTEEGYSYNPQLKCGDSNTIASSADDGLVVHYTFDEFAESTKNLTNDPIVDSIIPTNDEDNLYENWRFGSWLGFIHEKVTADIEEHKNALKITGNTTVVGNNDFWDIGWRDNTIVGNTYTFSFYAKGIGTIQISSHWAGTLKTITLTPELKRYSVTFTRGGTDTNYFWIKTIGLKDGEYLHVEGFQVEEKDHVTPFVIGTRESQVIDKSTNSYNSTLELTTTPEWKKDGSNGYYEFNGYTTNIFTPLITEIVNANGDDKPLSLSFWFHPLARINNYDGFVNILASTGNYDGLLASFYGGDATYRVRFWQDGGTNISIPVSDSFTTWKKMNLIVKDKTIRIYLNGEFISSTPFINDFSFNGVVSLGRYLFENNYFRGYMDEIRIYNRALSEEEIKYQYDTQKSIYE